MIVLCLAAGVFFSVAMRFPQLRLIRDMVGQLLGGKSSARGVSSFQGFAMALGGRVGTGNITGVASAIYFGGPGAVFWMWAIAFLGAGSAYIESALAQVWKEEIHGEYRGGPAYYIEQGLRSPRLGAAFALLTILSCGVLLPGIQSNSFAVAARGAFGVSPVYMAALYVILLGYIIFGGGKRIARAAEMIVPFMAAGYIVLAIVILVVNAQKIPSILSLIFGSAFNMNALYGAVFGQAVSYGVKRGVFSNEAGQGTGAQAAGAAEVSHPAKQGLVQAFSVYVDTLFICTATAVMILATDSFNVALPAGGMLVENLPGVASGNFTQTAVNTIGTGFGGIFVAIALFFFTLTTMLAYAFYVDSNVGYLFRSNSEGRGYRATLNASRVAIIFMVFISTVMSADVVWNFGSAGVGMMAWFNVIAILLLARPGIATLRDYEAQKRLGLDPVFVPERCGIRGAGLWHEIARRGYPEQLERLRGSGDSGCAGEE
ncbi:MAG: alanine/glycine:cation symporter family protein [Candidatus Krumholzibacteria bacterium]|nr:alanine/glycine:cation symporter family protein [Candidatus Krumholzibacteria bacterium]